MKDELIKKLKQPPFPMAVFDYAPSPGLEPGTP